MYFAASCVVMNVMNNSMLCVCAQAELEALNSAAESINKLENELQVRTCVVTRILSICTIELLCRPSFAYSYDQQTAQQSID